MSDLPRPSSATYRWARLGQYALNVILVGVAADLAFSDRRLALFVVALMVVAFMPFSYARLRGQRVIERLGVDSRRHKAVVCAYTALAMVADMIMLGQLITARSQLGPNFLQGPGIMWVGPVWFSAHALLLLGIGIAALGRLLARGTGRILQAIQLGRVVPISVPVNLARRQLIKQAGLLSVGTPFIVSLSGVKLSYDFRVQEHEITLPHWPRALDGLRVAHLSDIHVGGAMNRTRLLHVAALTNTTKPDVVVHTGDFLTHRSGAFDEPLYEALAKIGAPYGQWACLGNHDYDDADRLVQRLQDAGVTTLRNRLTTLSVAGQPLELAGLDFFFRGRRGATSPDILGLPRDGTPRLVLNHDPRTFWSLPQNCADLVCSGHTHGGHIGVQLGPNFALTVIGLVGIPDQGLFTHDDMRLFVTRCVGFYGYPMRLGIPPEISLLVLRAA